MNAVRVFVRELTRSEIRDNTRLLAEHCDAIALLVDLIQEMLAHYPSWGEWLYVLVLRPNLNTGGVADY